VGRVEEPWHKYDAFWIVFSLRVQGTFDFDTQTGHFNILLGSHEPVDNAEGWPVFREAASVSGFAKIQGAPADSTTAP
jgi:hypothetical protein